MLLRHGAYVPHMHIVRVYPYKSPILEYERLSFIILTAKEKSATTNVEWLNKYKLKKIYKINTQRKVLKESQFLYKCLGKQYTYMFQVIYNYKLDHKCALTPLDPRLLYVSPILAKRHPSVRETCLYLYSYLSVLCVLCLAACDTSGQLSVLCSVSQLPMCTM